MMKGQDPKILPWLARRAGISETRAKELWADAIRHATETTGWVGTSEYWRVAVERWLDLIEAERTARPVRRPGMVRLQTLALRYPALGWFFMGGWIMGHWLTAASVRRPAH